MNSSTDDGEAFAQKLCTELALGAPPVRFPDGSVPVFAVSDRYVLKLFPRHAQRHFETEVAALERIDGRLSIPTPRVVAHGEREDWWFVAMTRLAGRSLAEVWPTLEQRERRQLVQDLGKALAELHATPTGDLAPLSLDWPEFVQAQRLSARERQAAKGLQGPWLEQIEPFLERWAPADDGRRVLLHTEVMREHLLVERSHEGWRLSGLVDFEPAMLGAPEYELKAVGLFVTCAEPGLLGALLQAYGQEPDETFPQRLMAYALLHRYSNLRWYLERLPHAGSDELEALARAWFSA